MKEEKKKGVTMSKSEDDRPAPAFEIQAGAVVSFDGEPLGILAEPVTFSSGRPIPQEVTLESLREMARQGDEIRQRREEIEADLFRRLGLPADLVGTPEGGAAIAHLQELAEAMRPASSHSQTLEYIQPPGEPMSEHWLEERFSTPEEPMSESLEYEWVPLSSLQPGEKFVTEDGRKGLVVESDVSPAHVRYVCLDRGKRLLFPKPDEVKVRRLEVADRAEVAALIRGTPATLPDYPHGERPNRAGVAVTTRGRGLGGGGRQKVDYLVRDVLAPLLAYLDCHPREQAFIRHLCEQPLDGDTAAVFADWLEEEGREVAGGRVRALRIEDGDVLVVDPKAIRNTGLGRPGAIGKLYSDEIREQVGKDVRVAFISPEERLEVLPRPAEGSVAVLRVPDPYHLANHEWERIAEIENALGPCLVLNTMERLENADPAELREAGWVRREEADAWRERIAEVMHKPCPADPEALDWTYFFPAPALDADGHVNAAELLEWLDSWLDALDDETALDALVERRALAQVIDHVRSLLPDSAGGPDA